MQGAVKGCNVAFKSNIILEKGTRKNVDAYSLFLIQSKCVPANVILVSYYNNLSKH